MLHLEVREQPVARWRCAKVRFSDAEVCIAYLARGENSGVLVRHHALGPRLPSLGHMKVCLAVETGNTGG
jgi:hypothetical protein